MCISYLCNCQASDNLSRPGFGVKVQVLLGAHCDQSVLEETNAKGYFNRQTWTVGVKALVDGHQEAVLTEERCD